MVRCGPRDVAARQRVARRRAAAHVLFNVVTAAAALALLSPLLAAIHHLGVWLTGE